MTGCLTIDDVLRISREPLDEMRRTSEELDPADASSCDIFREEVIKVETVLRQTYKAAALTARQTETPEQEAAVWQSMRSYADTIIELLKVLKDAYPTCGTPELYNLALDYRQAADKRLSLTNEASQCQNHPMPPGLFPQAT